MQTTLALDPVKSATSVSTDTELGGGAGRILLRVLETLDRAGIAYCLLHGYESYPERIRSDVDCIISATAAPRKLVDLFHRNRAFIGAEVVRITGYYFVFSAKNTDGSPCLLDLHLSAEYDFEGQHFYAGSEILNSRRRHRQFWVPAARVEFCSYFIKKTLKGHLAEEQELRLSNLYRQDPAGCEREIALFWGDASAALIVSSSSSGRWDLVRSNLKNLRVELCRRAALRHPWRLVHNRLRRFTGRFQRLCKPTSGLNIIFLGPDGAGKSSVIHTVQHQLGASFVRTSRDSFPPELLNRLLRRPRSETQSPNKLPHAAVPRSFSASAIRAVLYWFAYYTIGYFLTDRVALARGTLVMHDRHLIDSVVDPRRYRYGGPRWLLRLICRSIPQSDLVILLDAPAEVLQSRKQEVPFAETIRQRKEYLVFVGSLKNGHVVTAGRPLAQVVADVNNIILHYLTTRIARRYGLDQTS